MTGLRVVAISPGRTPHSAASPDGNAEKPYALALLFICFALIAAGCGSSPADPFAAAPLLLSDGVPRQVQGNLLALGPRLAGEVIEFRATGPELDGLLLLARDLLVPTSGVIVGGGPPGEFLPHRFPREAEYFIYLRYRPTAFGSAQDATITIRPGDSAYRPPARQIVRVEFAENFLTDPGLWDPVDGTSADRMLLESIAGTVRQEIVRVLRQTFAGTPIEIITIDDPAPDQPYSKLIYLPDRILADRQDAIDAALPPPDPDRPQCQQRVVFGQVLPEGTHQDLGNRSPDDIASVYVGSFQGRGRECWTAAINSTSNLVLALAQTGAHEIGHLVGMLHVEQIDLMNRSATLAFVRDLEFARGQVQLDRTVDGEIVSEVFPHIVQEPATYFQSVFENGPILSPATLFPIHRHRPCAATHPPDSVDLDN